MEIGREFHCRRQAVQRKLYLEQCYVGASAIAALDKEYGSLRRVFDAERGVFCIDV